MLVKFETKSARVKGISFHPTRPWVLTSLHSGTIQLWDYRIGSMVDRYEEHEGPVRGISFHKTQPLFVSGGDDYKIKGWNYKLKKCIFTLTGHLDYIRTVYFHHELPWILSSSDDQTIRIWNYQSRSLISILTGHSHYVMCAQFHPSKDLIISCSLDQTLRLWDFTNLRKKYTSSGVGKRTESFNASDVEIKCVLEGHDRGVNWCAFHHSLNMIVSGSDDRKVKIWKYTETKAWEHDSLYGHGHNVSCVAFSTKMDIIISNSEDKTIRVWDLNKRILLETFKRECERFWILGLHPESNIVASGSDAGMVMFSLVKERIHHQIHNNTLFFLYKKQLKSMDLKKKVVNVLRDLDYQEQNLIYNTPKSLYYNTFDTSKHNFLISYDNKEPKYFKYQIFRFEGDLNSKTDLKFLNQKFAYSTGAVFTSKGKLAKLREDKTISIEDYESDHFSNVQTVPTENIFPGPLGKIILKTENAIILYDLTNKKIINEYCGCDAAQLKRVVWNNSHSLVALLCKKNIIVMNKNFNKITVISEKFNIKSIIWLMDTILMYCTVNHLKFGLLNGDTGILKCLESPIYLLQLESESSLQILNRDGTVSSIFVDLDELLFKHHLYNKDSKKIKFMLSNSKKLGNSLISYLFRKNYSAIALTLVDNPKARFSLAIDSGNLEVAFKTSMELKDKECFLKLGEEALRQGNQQLVEMAYQNSKNFEKLSFFYLITGNLTKLEKMLYIAQNRGDIMSRFQNAIFLGDIHERIKILAETGQLSLAYMMAVLHNIPDMAIPLKQSLGENISNIDLNFKSFALVPRKPLIQDIESSKQTLLNWPHNSIVEEDILQSKEEDEPKEIIEAKNELDLDIEPQIPSNEEETKNVEDNTDLELDQDNWGIEDVDIPEVAAPAKELKTESLTIAYTPNPIISAGNSSIFAGEQVACGLFENALELLKKQIGVTNIEPYRNVFLNVYLGAGLLISPIPFTSPLNTILNDKNHANSVISINILENELKLAYKFTTEGLFNDAIEKFRQILLMITLFVAKVQKEKDEALALIRICLDYIIALRCEVLRKSTTDQKRGMELSAYMSACNLQPSHRILSLRASMSIAYKLKNFIYASFFAKKIMKLNDDIPNVTKPEVVQNAKKVFIACEQQGTNESKIDFDETMLNNENMVLNICGRSLTYISEKNPKKCPLDGSRYKNNYDGEICDVCKVCKIGVECLGLKLGI